MAHISDAEAVRSLAEASASIRKEIGKAIIGQHDIIDQLLISLFSRGHCLLVGVPGLAKTLLIRTLAKSMNLTFNRIQFTPDLMPSDITGTEIIEDNMVTGQKQFRFVKGPVFAQIVLADEINRTPPKTQAALFEVMEERQITIDNHTFIMDKPFLVFATQNPIEQEGTYRLPEAQLDRFLFKIQLEYPTAAQEVELLQREHNLQNKDKIAHISASISKQHIIDFQQLTKLIVVESKLIEYIAKIIIQTRENSFLYMGASPRASIAILNASKGLAILRGRDFVTPEDIKEVAIPVLNHRVVVAPEREMEGMTSNDIIQQILDTIEIPR